MGTILAIISTHAPAGGATKLDAETNTLSVISTHAPAGGATDAAVFYRRTAAFLLTPLREGRPAGYTSGGTVSLFLLTPLREGRLKSATLNADGSVFLLTPLREGRHGL